MPSARVVEVTPLEGAQRDVQLAPPQPGRRVPERVDVATGVGEQRSVSHIVAITRPVILYSTCEPADRASKLVSGLHGAA